MARPVDADSEKTYDGIVAAALRVLERAGPEINLRMVAAEAECSLGTIQYYFGSKSDLLEACLDGYYGRLQKVASTLLTELASREGRELVEHSTRTLYRWIRSERALVRLRLATNVERGELHPARQPEFLGWQVEKAAAALVPHVEVDQFDARLGIQVLSFFVARLILLDDEEVEALTGETGARAVAELEERVVTAARRLFRPSDG